MMEWAIDACIFLKRRIYHHFNNFSPSVSHVYIEHGTKYNFYVRIDCTIIFIQWCHSSSLLCTMWYVCVLIFTVSALSISLSLPSSFHFSHFCVFFILRTVNTHILNTARGRQRHRIQFFQLQPIRYTTHRHTDRATGACMEGIVTGRTLNR